MHVPGGVWLVLIPSGAAVCLPGLGEAASLLYSLSAAEIKEALHKRADPFIFMVRKYRMDAGSGQIDGDLHKRTGRQFFFYREFR